MLVYISTSKIIEDETLTFDRWVLVYEMSALIQTDFDYNLSLNIKRETGTLMSHTCIQSIQKYCCERASTMQLDWKATWVGITEEAKY